MSLCLEHGGDINLNVPMGREELKFTTPLLMFLDALDERAWAKAAVGADASASALITNLKYLLDHGADPLEPSHPNVFIYLWLDDPYGNDYEPTEGKAWWFPTDPPADMPLGRWGVEYLANPAFALAIRMVLTHPSVSADRTARTLARACAQPGARTLTAAWRRLVDAVIEHFAAAGKLDELLFVFVVRTAAIHKFVVGKERQEFVRFLVEECGADPYLRFDGCYFPLDSFLNKFNMRSRRGQGGRCEGSG
ncbi:hypothetical protein RB594_008292 [Gaeumannomyces avenae]